MHSQGALATDQSSIDNNPLSYYLAAIEAMDYQIGRLLESMSQEELDNTIIIFVGDNGTPGSVAQSPYERGKTKGSVYQGGVNTPMFIAGPVVSRTGTEDALINGTDLFATISSLAGANAADIHDSKDFSSLLQGANPGFRDYLYSEAIDGMQGTNLWAARNMTYKLIENSTGDQELYNLIEDPYEIDNLLNSALSGEEEAAKMSLESEISRIRG
jgi:arylsulfatase A-like enzyme